MGLAVPTGTIAGQQTPGYSRKVATPTLFTKVCWEAEKFIKTVLCKDKTGSQVVVKVYVKEIEILSLHAYEDKLKFLRQSVSYYGATKYFSVPTIP